MPSGHADRVTQMTRAGIAAAVAVAREQGLAAGAPRLLSSRGNVLVHLAPAPVVARVATLTAWSRGDPFGYLEREVVVARELAGRGAPVVPPTALADPGPHWHGGLAVSLWTLTPDSGDRPGPAAAGRALARLHQAGAGIARDLPVLAPIADLSESIGILERERAAEPDTAAALRRRHAEVLAEVDAAGGTPLRVLHGDAHAGNLLTAGRGWTWIDLEETCSGPREFDLAVLASSSGPRWDSPGAPAIALAAYAAETGGPTPGLPELAPFTRARDLQAAVWVLGMAHQYPDRYGPQLPGRLARALSPDNS